MTIAEACTGIIEGRESPGRTFYLMKYHMRLVRNVTRTVIFYDLTDIRTILKPWWKQSHTVSQILL